MVIKGVCLTFLGIGVFVMMQVLMPILAFKVWEFAYYDQSQILVDPKPKNLAGKLIGGAVLGVSIENINNFPTIFSNNQREVPYSEFKLTVPRINLYGVKVLVDSNDFSLNLAHLPGSGLPGEKGNVFISGHSSILQSLSDKEKALFINLPGIKKGDNIILQALGEKYEYEVIGLKIVDPKDISVVNPPDEEGRYVSLMTCVPPGFNTKRLIVLGRLKAG